GLNGLTPMVIALSPAYPTDHTIFLGTLERGLLKSTDAGKSFVATGLGDAFVTALDVSSAFSSDHTLYASSYQGTYGSIDGGANWVQMATPRRFEEDQPGFIRTGNWNSQQLSGSSCGLVI